MKYLSLCSGIEAASVAWHPLGWRPFAFSEIDAFPSAVLAHHYPTTPNLGDMTKFKDWPDATFDILVGGTPCQSFSVAGLRKGLHDPRGNLMLTFGAIAARYRPAWLVWENVPGVLSSNRGRDFGTFLGMLGELGYGFAYRVLDAQFFGVPQRRRRVFVVGYLGDWRAPFAVLFERHSLQGHPAPRRATGQGFAAATAPSLTASGRGVGRTGESRGQDPVVAVAGDAALKSDPACPLDMTSGQANAEIASDRAPTLNCLHEAPILAAPDIFTLAIRGRGDGRDLETRTDGTANAILTPNGGRDGIGVGAVAFKASHYTRGKDGAPAEVAPPLSADADKGDQDTLIAFSCKDYGNDAGETAPTLRSMNHAGSHQNGGGQVAICCPTADSLTVGANQTTGFVGDCVAMAFDLAQITSKTNATRVSPELPASTLNAAGQMHAVTYGDVAGTLKACSGKSGTPNGAEEVERLVANPMQVRRLTPRECERLQGFPDDYTLIQVRGKPAADGPRYKALGNSMAVPVMAWIGERIQLVDGILAEQAKAAE